MIRAAAALIAFILAGGVLGQPDLTTVTAGSRKAGAAVTVPFALDTTEAIAARDRMFIPPDIIRPVPQGVPLPGAGRRGPSFMAQPDGIQELFGGFGAPPAFPGPYESGWTPGDPNLAVGPTHVLCTVNGRISIYTRAGAQTFTAVPDNFFANLGLPGSPFDCRCAYDTSINRFWMMYALSDGTGNQGWWLVALSDDDNPNGTWAMWKLDASLNGSNHVNMWLDYPGLGYDKDVLLLCGNMYGDYSGAKVRVMTKDQFLAGSPTITWTDFWDISQPNGGRAWSVQPARTLGSSKMPYFCNVSGLSSVNLYGIENATTSPTIIKRAMGASIFGGNPPNARQKGGDFTLWVVDQRIYDVHCRDDYLTFTHNVGYNGACAVRWYEIDATRGVRYAVLRQHNIMAPADTDIYFGNLVTNGSGHQCLSFTRSGPNEYISIYFAGRVATDPLNTLGAQTPVYLGDQYFNDGIGRWGDYSGLVMDPVDDHTFWGLKMLPRKYVQNQWRTEVFTVTVGTAATLHGSVDLGDWIASPAGMTATVEFRQLGTTNVAHSYPVTLDANGEFTVPAVWIGTFDVAVRFPHWLREVLAGVTTAEGPNGVAFSLINGDADGDNEIGLTDLNQVLARIGSTDPSADLDGSGSVGLPDLNVVLLRFGLTGDD